MTSPPFSSLPFCFILRSSLVSAVIGDTTKPNRHERQDIFQATRPEHTLEYDRSSKNYEQRGVAASKECSGHNSHKKQDVLDFRQAFARLGPAKNVAIDKLLPRSSFWFNNSIPVCRQDNALLLIRYIVQTVVWRLLSTVL
jgi:hypothetical protein